MLKMENVRKTYGTFSLECSLEILPGRITGLIGQNGAGKSTTFKLALGVTLPDSGTITVMGRNIKAGMGSGIVRFRFQRVSDHQGYYSHS